MMLFISVITACGGMGGSGGGGIGEEPLQTMHVQVLSWEQDRRLIMIPPGLATYVEFNQRFVFWTDAQNWTSTLSHVERYRSDQGLRFLEFSNNALAFSFVISVRHGDNRYITYGSHPDRPSFTVIPYVSTRRNMFYDNTEREPLPRYIYIPYH